MWWGCSVQLLHNMEPVVAGTDAVLVRRHPVVCRRGGFHHLGLSSCASAHRTRVPAILHPRSLTKSGTDLQFLDALLHTVPFAMVIALRVR